MFVPERGRGRVIQFSVSLAAVRRVVLALSLLAAAGVVAGGGLLAGLPAIWSYDRVLQENIVLKSRLRDIEGNLEEVESSLRRVQLFDAQLRDLSGSPLFPGGTGGPDDDLPVLVGEPDSPGLEPADLRPAELWARSVETRSTELLRLLDDMEPRLNDLTVDIADMLSVQSALPQQWPVLGILTSGFGYRKHPMRRRWNFHPGIDISAPRGSTIYAVAAGTVEVSEYEGGYGRMVLLDHGYGIKTRYAHNTSLFVKQGDYVEAGQVIATVGTTGQTTGPHLHFEMLLDGRTVDPLDYLPN